MKKRAILYLRFSDTKQIGNTSEDTQEKICRNACVTEDFMVTEVAKNPAVSANKTNTQRIIELIDFCKERQGKFDVLMVFKLDRFARNQEQHHYLRGQLLKMGIILRSATERIDESPSGQLVEGVLAAVNEYDNEIKKERVTLAMWSRVEHGLWPWNPPLGYMPTPRPINVKLLPHIMDDTCSEIVKEIFLRYSTGAFSQADLVRTYSKKRIKNHKGQVIKFSQTSIYNMLNNIYYTGFVKHKDGRLIKGGHTALIKSSLYQKCQEIQDKLSNNATNKKLYNHPDFPLRRFVFCEACKKGLTACWSTGSKGVKYAYYYCKTAKCSEYGKTIKRQELHDGFYNYVKSVKPKDEFISFFKAVFMKRYEERKQDIKGDYLRKLEDIKQLEKDQEWLVEKGKKGIIPDELLQKQLAESEQQIMLSKMSLNESFDEELGIEALLSYAEVFIRTPEIAWFDAPSDGKLKYQRLIFPEGIYYSNNNYSNPKLGLPFKLINTIASKNSTNVTPREFESRFPE